MYKVIIQFADLKDGGHLYNAGDTYPREGFEVSDARIKELSGGENRRHIALIEQIPDKEGSAEVKDEPRRNSGNVKSKPRKSKQR